MPGRPRLFTDDAEKQREHRARQKERRERLESRIREDAALWATAHRLREAVAAAAETGDRFARQIQNSDSHCILSNLADYFEEIASPQPASGAPESKPVPPVRSGRRQKGTRKEIER